MACAARSGRGSRRHTPHFSLVGVKTRKRLLAVEFRSWLHAANLQKCSSLLIYPCLCWPIAAVPRSKRYGKRAKRKRAQPSQWVRLLRRGIQFMSAWRNVDAGKRCLNPDLVKTSRPNSVATRLECQAVRLSGELARCVANYARPKPENIGGIPMQVRILPRSTISPITNL